jgi:MFS family permease
MSEVSSCAIAVILCLQIVIGCLSSIFGQYIYAFYLQSSPYPSNSSSNYTTTSTSRPFYSFEIFNNETNKCPQGDIAPDAGAQAWAQQHSADLLFWINSMSSFPVIIMTYILGLYIPKLGKRFVVLLPMLGTTIQVAIWLAVIYFHLPQFWWYIAAVIIGLSGSGGVLGMSVRILYQAFYKSTNFYA